MCLMTVTMNVPTKQDRRQSGEGYKLYRRNGSGGYESPTFPFGGAKPTTRRLICKDGSYTRYLSGFHVLPTKRDARMYRDFCPDGLPKERRDRDLRILKVTWRGLLASGTQSGADVIVVRECTPIIPEPRRKSK